jgi:hypothetical protein
MTEAILGIGLICFSMSLWMFARALRHNTILPGATGQIITSAQWAHLRHRAVESRGAAPRRQGLQAPNGRLN